jgi:hypothetical protein
MRLPFPERIPLPTVFFAATVLAGLQQVQGTSILFSVFCYLFIVIAAVAFNVAGGFTRTTGSYVFFYSVLGAIFGLVYKAYLGEPADSNLRSPVLTMEVFTGGITAMLLAVIISRKISRKRPLLQTVLKEKDMKNAAIGCFTFGMVTAVITVFVPHGSGSFLSALAQLNHFLPMSVIIATIHAIKKSGGRRSVDLLVIITMATCLGFGFVNFSKEAMFAPIFSWLVTTASLRKDFRAYQIGLGILGILLIIRYLVPYSQYGRTQIPEDDSFFSRTVLSVSLLTNLEQVRQEYLDHLEPTEDLDTKGYYDHPQGFLDRLSMIGPDDALINYTNQGNYTGIGVVAAYFANWVPHFLWPSKPTFLPGNVYARMIGGIIGEEDYSTGISFTPTGEAYQLAGWTGIFVVAPVIWIMLFTIFDSLCGDVRTSPWGLLAIPMYAHLAPEAMLGGAVYLMWFGALGIVFVAVGTAQAMPIIGTLLAGPEKTELIRLRKRGLPRSLASSRPAPELSA